MLRKVVYRGKEWRALETLWPGHFSIERRGVDGRWQGVAHLHAWIDDDDESVKWEWCDADEARSNGGVHSVVIEKIKAWLVKNPPCCKTCLGLAVFNIGDPAPDDWVEIERCDGCGRYETDDEAALAVSRKARPWDEIREEFGPKLTSREATLRAWYQAHSNGPAGSCRLFVPDEDAVAFGLDW